MKYLFYNTTPINKVAIGILSDEAEKLADAGHEVYFVTCGGIMNSCLANFESNRGICKVCRFWNYMAEKKLSNKIKKISLKDYENTDEKYPKYEYSDYKELKQITYKKSPIGLALLSSYINNTRNLYPLINQQTKPFYDNSLLQAQKIVDAAINIVESLNPDGIYIYNGRFMETRPFYEIALQRHIPFYSVEVIFGKEPGNFYKAIYENSLPHDIKLRHSLILKTWDSSPKTYQEKAMIGESFFLKRRGKQHSGDRHIYIENQVKGLLPDDWDENKINIAIFNSSEDEFAAIGDDYEKLTLFPNQIEGLKSILKKFENTNYHFYLRVHPNLGSVKYSYHHKLYNLPNEFTNITVIPADSNIDSYHLMEMSEKVIVFNSTMGIEATYWKKPVILLSPSYYYYSDLCYIPKNVEDLYLLIKSTLAPKFNDFVYKFGYYIIDFSEATNDKKQFSFIDFNTFEVTMGGRKATGANYQTLFGSKKLLLYTVSILRECFSRLFKNCFVVPIDEDLSIQNN